MATDYQALAQRPQPVPGAGASLNPAVANQLRYQMAGAQTQAQGSPMASMGGSLAAPAPAAPALANAAPQAAFSQPPPAPVAPPMAPMAAPPAPKMGGKSSRAPTRAPRGKSVQGPLPGPSQGRGSAY